MVGAAVRRGSAMGRGTTLHMLLLMLKAICCIIIIIILLNLLALRKDVTRRSFVALYVCMYCMYVCMYCMYRNSEMQREAEGDLLKGNLVIGFMKVGLHTYIYIHTLEFDFFNALVGCPVSEPKQAAHGLHRLRDDIQGLHSEPGFINRYVCICMYVCMYVYVFTCIFIYVCTSAKKTILCSRL